MIYGYRREWNRLKSSSRRALKDKEKKHFFDRSKCSIETALELQYCRRSACVRFRFLNRVANMTRGININNGTRNGSRRVRTRRGKRNYLSISIGARRTPRTPSTVLACRYTYVGLAYGGRDAKIPSLVLGRRRSTDRSDRIGSQTRAFEMFTDRNGFFKIYSISRSSKTVQNQ